MIVTCKFCKGSGRSSQNALAYILGGQKPCPACRGAGEPVLPEPIENYVICKICRGTGFIENPFNVLGTRTLCSVCKGAGLLTRPILQSSAVAPVTTVYGPLPRPSTFDFDVALSFAGEDREIAESYSQILKTKGLRVFLDFDEQVDLWGADPLCEA